MHPSNLNQNLTLALAAEDNLQSNLGKLNVAD
jgi:hypothetical protein